MFKILIVCVALVLPICVKAQSNEELLVTLKQLQQTVERQNELLDKFLAPPPPPKHPKMVKTMKVVNSLGSVALVALPIILKNGQNQQATVVKVTH